MNKTALALIVALAMMLVIAGCSSKTPATPTDSKPTETPASAAKPAETPATAAPSETPAAKPAENPAPVDSTVVDDIEVDLGVSDDDLNIGDMPDMATTEATVDVLAEE